MASTTTITISEQTRRDLLKMAGRLQEKQGRKVDYEDVIRYLLSKSRRRDERLLLSAVKETGRSSAEIHDALLKGRAEDRAGEEALGRRYLS